MIPILIQSLLLTLAVELTVGALLGLRRRGDVRDLTLINLVTNPPAVFVITLVRKFSPTFAGMTFVLVEGIVFVLEWALLHKAVGLERKRALFVSVLCNSASMLAGMLG